MSDRREKPRALPRRRFLQRSGVALGAGLAASLGTAQAGPPAQEPTGAPATASLGTHPILDAVAPIVLPSESLGENRVADPVERFRAWAAAFEPVAELDHPYLWTDEIRYGPPDPRPAWLAQLDAFDLEAQARFEKGFLELDRDRQEGLIRAAVDRSLPAGTEPLGRPETAPHIAIALMSWYFRSSGANDLCHRRRIGRHECRGMRGVEREPRPLPERGA